MIRSITYIKACEQIDDENLNLNNYDFSSFFPFIPLFVFVNCYREVLEIGYTTHGTVSVLFLFCIYFTVFILLSYSRH